MPQLELYENKIITDREFPLQLSVDHVNTISQIFSIHWHEHVEIHFIVEGSADVYLGQKAFQVQAGDLFIANSNELHSAYCTSYPYTADVIIFEMSDLSEELASKNFIFQAVVHHDPAVKEYVQKLFVEMKQQQLGYKQECRALVTQLLVYLCRNYVVHALPQRDSAKRKKDMERLNVVLAYIENHYSQRITVDQLAEMVCLSEDRFGHLFRDGVGEPPLHYINNLRLSKALKLLKINEYTVTEVADAVGFRDYNHFTRLFRKRYGCSPNDVKRGKVDL